MSLTIELMGFFPPPPKRLPMIPPRPELAPAQPPPQWRFPIYSMFLVSLSDFVSSVESMADKLEINHPISCGCPVGIGSSDPIEISAFLRYW
jgi:hypothetical protein